MASNELHSRLSDDFVRLTAKHQRSIYWYILALLPHLHDADEVFQETNIVLWRKFEQFELGTNFLAWACRVARWEVFRYCDKHKRDVANFSDVLGADLTPDELAAVGTADRVFSALDECLSHLKSRDRELVYLRCLHGATVKAIAEKVGQPGHPQHQGFDDFFGYLNQVHAQNYWPDFLYRGEEKVVVPNEMQLAPRGYWGFRGGWPTKPVVYSQDLFADEALKRIESHKDGPFFLYLALTLSHANNEAAGGLGNGAEVPDYGI